MTSIVIDASVSASWLLPDETNEYGMQIFNGLLTKPAIVPSIWDYEMRNILIINERRGRIDRHAVDAALDVLAGLNIMTDRATDWRHVVALSRQHGLTIYDAAYLELAIRLDLPLATFDKALISAANKAGRLKKTSLEQ